MNKYLFCFCVVVSVIALLPGCPFLALGPLRMINDSLLEVRYLVPWAPSWEHDMDMMARTVFGM